MSAQTANSFLSVLPDPALTKLLETNEASLNAELENGKRILKGFNEAVSRSQVVFDLASEEGKAGIVSNQISAITGIAGSKPKDDNPLRKNIKEQLKAYEANNGVIISTTQRMDEFKKQLTALTEKGTVLTQEERRKKGILTGLIAEEAKRADSLKNFTQGQLAAGDQAFKNARQQGILLETTKQLNGGQQIEIDQNNILTQQSIKDGSQLHLLQKLLIAEGYSEVEARARLTA